MADDTFGVGSEFDSFNDFDNALRLYCNRNNVVMVKTGSRTVVKANETLPKLAVKYDDRFKFSYVQYQCKHGGEYRRSGLGKRPNQREVLYEDLHLPESSVQDGQVRYKILPQGSKRGNPLLVSSDGFTYGIKVKNDSITHWRCNIRSKESMCLATVIQDGDSFVRSQQEHNHSKGLKLKIRNDAQYEDLDLPESMVQRGLVTYKVLPEGSRRHTPLLVSSDGFTYGIKVKKDSVTYWRCSTRSKGSPCLVTVLQNGDNFIRSHHKHTHSHSVKHKLKNKTYKQRCPARIYVQANRTRGKLVVKSMSTEHNHVLDRSTFLQYPEMRRLNEEKLELAESMLKVGVKAKPLQEHLQAMGDSITVKDVHNIRQRIKQKPVVERKVLLQTEESPEISVGDVEHIQVVVSEDGKILQILNTKPMTSPAEDTPDVEQVGLEDDSVIKTPSKRPRLDEEPETADLAQDWAQLEFEKLQEEVRYYREKSSLIRLQKQKLELEIELLKRQCSQT